MTRESPYAVPHKGLRNALGRFQALADSTSDFVGIDRKSTRLNSSHQI